MSFLDLWRAEHDERELVEELIRAGKERPHILHDREIVEEMLAGADESQRAFIYHNWAPRFRKNPRPKTETKGYWWSYDMQWEDNRCDYIHGPYAPESWFVSKGRRIPPKPSLEMIEEWVSNVYPNYDIPGRG
jgi:hypothetical protein